MKFQTSTL